MSVMPGLPNFLAYFGACVALWVLSVALYVRVTPYHEFALVQQGNTAAACSLSGTALGLALPLASLAAHAVSLVDLLMWAGVALLLQLLLWLVASRTVLRGLTGAVEGNQVSVGLMLGALSTGVGLLNAGCLTY